MRRHGPILVAALATAIVTAGPAVGDGHEAPEVTLRFGERAQVGKMTAHTWSSGPIPPCKGCPPEGVYCGTGIAEFWGGGVPPRRVRSGWHTGYIDLRRPDAPDELVIRRASKGGPSDIAYALRPQEEGGQVVAWLADITFRVRKHLYLSAEAEWRDEEESDGCPEGVQATWAFHLKTRRA